MSAVRFVVNTSEDALQSIFKGLASENGLVLGVPTQYIYCILGLMKKCLATLDQWSPVLIESGISGLTYDQLVNPLHACTITITLLLRELPEALLASASEPIGAISSLRFDQVRAYAGGEIDWEGILMNRQNAYWYAGQLVKIQETLLSLLDEISPDTPVEIARLEQQSKLLSTHLAFCERAKNLVAQKVKATKTGCQLELGLNLSRLMHEHISHPLTTDQETAISKISAYLSGADPNKVLIIRGYAGTGKTTLIGALAKTLSDLQLNYDLIAPTGKAARVMSAYARQSAKTIHSAIFELTGTVEDEPIFRLSSSSDNTIYILDEASMLSSRKEEKGQWGSDGILQQLMHYVLSGKGNRLIIVGDNAQLPPINDEISHALMAASLKILCNVDATEVELRKVVRQKQESGILKLATQIRAIHEDIDSERDLGIPLPDLEDIQYVGQRDMMNVYKEVLQEYGLPDVCLLAHSNANVLTWNLRIRQEILNRQQQVSLGESLLVVNNNHHWQPNEGEWLANGEIVQVLETGQEERLGRFLFQVVTIGVATQNGDQKQLSGMIHTGLLADERRDLSPRERAELRRTVLKQYPTLTNGNLKAAMQNDPYWNALEVKYAYAVTVHKAQGSQWPVVILDLSAWNWYNSKHPDTSLNWLYTAVTRAKRKLIITGLPEDRSYIPLYKRSFPEGARYTAGINPIRRRPNYPYGPAL